MTFMSYVVQKRQEIKFSRNLQRSLERDTQSHRQTPKQSETTKNSFVRLKILKHEIDAQMNENARVSSIGGLLSDGSDYGTS